MKKSGFAVTIKAFFPAEATDGDAMVKMLNKISDVLIAVGEAAILMAPRSLKRSETTP